MKALIFDLDDTLYDQQLPFERALLAFCSFPLDQMGELYKRFRHYSDLTFEDSVSGQLAMKDMHLYRLKQALADFGVQLPDERILEIQEEYAHQQGQLELMSGAADVFLTCQQKGIQLGIITNGPHLHQLKKLDALEMERWIPRDRWIISGEVGMTKPNPAIFQLMEKRLSCPVEDICYVGDSFDNDILGSKQAGWQAVWFNHRKRMPSSEFVTADLTIASMTDLRNWILSSN